MALKTRKKNFLIIEVIIGLALFSLCALPLIRQPFLFAQKSREQILEAELARQAEVVHCDIIADLQTGNIAWDSLPKKPRERLSLSNSPYTVHIGGLEQKYTQTTSLRLKSSKQTNEENEARLFEIFVSYSKKGREKPHSFSYLVSVIGPAPKGCLVSQEVYEP